MDATIVKLSFQGPVHFGAGRLTDGAYTCDAATLFSALYIEALRMGEAERLLAAAKRGDFALSDAFPFVGTTFYLPKPMVAPGTFVQKADAKGGDSRERKANKRLGYVPAAKYADYMAGRFDAVAELERFKPGVGSLRAKVNLERLNGPDAEPYFVGGFSFAKNAGLYFLVQGSYDCRPILEQLSYSGIGGKRSSGYGRFTYTVASAKELGCNLNLGASPRGSAGGSAGAAGGSGASVLLSTAAPTQAELGDELLAGARYRLVRKGGFVQSATHSDKPQKKRDLYLFAAGSMFARRFEGDVFDVNATPGAHPVYRYARAFWMGV